MTEPSLALPPGLYVVSTPIGNLGDVTHRALATLGGVDLVLAEDTRETRKLLDRYDLHVRTEAYHEHNEASMVPRVLARLRDGARIALVSDAGTPLLSDPGQRLVAAAAEAGIVVVPIPGASALLAALVAAGVDAARFTFLGFLARKGGEREADLAAIVESPVTTVFYEAPPRLAATLADLAARAAEGAGSSAARPAAVARELTKLHEEVRRGTLAELAAYYADHPVRGELVVVVGGRPPAEPDEDAMRAAVARLRAEGASARDVLRVLVGEHGAPRNLAYRLAHEHGAGPGSVS